MRHNDGFHLIDRFESDAQLLPLHADCSIEALRAQFYDTLRESVDHPARDSLSVPMQLLLAHLETLPVLTAAHLAADDTSFFEGWLRYHSHYLCLISEHYRATDLRESCAPR